MDAPFQLWTPIFMFWTPFSSSGHPLLWFVHLFSSFLPLPLNAKLKDPRIPHLIFMIPPERTPSPDRQPHQLMWHITGASWCHQSWESLSKQYIKSQRIQVFQKKEK